MSAQRPKPTTRTAPGDLLASRGLPTILWNNDGDDLAWPAYPEHHADGLWCAGTPGSRHDDPIPLPRIHSLADYLAARIGPLAKTKTQGLSYCGNFGVPVWDLKRDQIAALGDDPLQPILQFWKQDGRTFFFSMRMNDSHRAFRNLPHDWSDFCRTHRHLFLKPPTDDEWETQFVPWLEGKGKQPAKSYPALLAFDYSRAEVRTYYLDTLREACCRYDLDGVEFDWLRFLFLFREGEVNAATMTDFIQEARAIVDEAAKRRGHPVRLVSRVPDTPEEALARGLDVKAWLKAGTLDAIIAGRGNNFSSCPLERWVALAHCHGVPVYGALLRTLYLGIPRFGSPETLRGAIATLWDKGADGLYFFNFVRRDEMPLLDEFGDRARLARLPKEYFLEPGSANDLEPSSGPLPLALAPGTTATASLFVADDPAQARDVSLEMRFTGAFEPPEVTLNRHPIAGLVPRHDASGLTLTLASAELRKALKRGTNEFRFTSPAGVATAELEFAREWTVFGPCAETDLAPAITDLAACPATLRLGDKALAARPVKATSRGIDLGQLLGDQRERQGAWVYIPVTAPRSGHYGIGLGADWWFEAFLDGKPLIDTLETGNLTNPPNRNNHLSEVELMAGVHTLAVRVLSGSVGWTLDAGAYRDGAKLTALSVRVAP